MSGTRFCGPTVAEPSNSRASGGEGESVGSSALSSSSLFAFGLRRRQNKMIPPTNNARTTRAMAIPAMAGVPRACDFGDGCGVVFSMVIDGLGFDPGFVGLVPVPVASADVIGTMSEEASGACTA